MQNSIIEENRKLIHNIIEHGKKKDAKSFSPNSLIEKFIKHFYKFVPLSVMQDHSTPELFEFAKSSFQFMNEFKNPSTDHKIDISIVKIKSHLNDQVSCIKVLNPDSPFLVDSIVEEISKLGYKTHVLIHPVFNIKRDNAGKIQDIFSCENKNHYKQKEYDLESLIYIHVVETMSKEKMVQMHENLTNVISHVKVAVSDWKSMCTNVEGIVKSHNFNEKNSEFLNWITKNNFTFLGCCQYDIDFNGDLLVPKLVKDKNLGISKINYASLDSIVLDNAYRMVNINPRQDEQIEIRKVNKKSLVHRNTNLDIIFIKIIDESQRISKIYALIGLFTSVVYYQSATLIPLIKQKIHNIIRQTGLPKVSFSAKEIVTIIESLPRDELFQMSEKELFNIAISILSLHANPKLSLHVRSDSVGQIVSCLIFLPKERFSTETSDKVKTFLLQEFGGQIVGDYTQVTNLRLAYIHIQIKTEKYEKFDSNILEKKLELITSLWNDNLANILINEFGNLEGETLFEEFKNAFPAAYREKFSPEISALRDITTIQNELNDSDIIFKLEYLENIESLLQLKVYSNNSVIALSEIMPMLDEMGFNTLDESIFLITPLNMQNQVWIHSFQLDLPNSHLSKLEDIKENVEEALSKVWSGQMQIDKFNSLILRSNLNWQQVTIIRALSKYLVQINFPYSTNYIAEILAKHAEISTLLIKMFYSKFDPSLDVDLDSRLKLVNQIKEAIMGKLQKVLNSAEDKVLKSYLNLIDSIFRTNFFQYQQDEDGTLYVSFKIESAKIHDIPSPAPFAEIFVYSPRFEAIHLRGGKVARGGLRWSDRIEDYRTEVLGLMKAQMAKNSVIVPVGSKGGFIIKKDTTNMSREDFMNEGIHCYKMFLSSMLDITDNIIDDKIVKPLQVICHDQDDPYLVVAADKGTATFSDIANEISAKYNFWLGDAFASGGSDGYDHKKMGITAKGACVSVQRHFMEMGHDTQTQDFTVVGIGDMSGDVFGNGMLLSEHIRLIAAFNHLHIFIDPAPNAAESFKERQRLFEMPRSTWSDYDESLISKGGGVFNRSSKTIKISKEIQKIIYDDSVPSNERKSELSPEQLIKHLLQADVDLIWNGGIGTYIKAEQETHEQVGDKANDSIRINGKNLNAKVIGEGGNLGATQLGRIEFAKNGGKINTDAIDNSAGVDCSDHEVNIKIAMQNAIYSGELTLKKRNKILEEMTDDVANLVLRDNKLQTQAITFEEHDGPKSLGMYVRLLQNLEKEGMLDRELEFLPNEEQLKIRAAAKKGLTRPEISVIMAYSKIAVYNNLVESNITSEPYFESDLMKYFPKKLQKNFTKYIINHPLKKEIIATFVANSIINRTGSHFFHLALEDTKFKGCDIARAYAITRASFNIRKIWDEIESLNGKIELEGQLEMLFEVKKFVQKMILWYLNNYDHPLGVNEIIENSQEGIDEMLKNLQKVISGEVKLIYGTRREKFKNFGAGDSLASKIASLKVLSASGDILAIANEVEMKVTEVAKTYFEIGTVFYFDFLRSKIDKLKNMDQYWQKLSVRTLKEDLYRQQKNLCIKILQHKIENKTADAMESWCEEHTKFVKNYESFISDLKSIEEIDFSMAVVAAKRLEALIYL